MSNQKEEQKKWYIKNKERLNMKHKEYYIKNREKCLNKEKENYQINKNERLNYQTEYRKNNKSHIKLRREQDYKKNKEQILLINKIWRENNQKKLKKNRIEYNRRYRKNHREYINNYPKNRKKKDREFLLKIRLRSRLSTALKLYTLTGKIMPSGKYNINFKEIIEYLKPFPENLNDYHIHHIIPLFAFHFINPDGSTNLEEIKKAFSPKNHQIMLKEEHRKLNHYFNN